MIMNSVGKLSAKYDQDKLRWDLIPLEAVEECVKILTFGAQKYGENKWQHLEDFENRYFAAAMRHLVAYKKGEKVDSESGNLHLSHALTNLVFLIWKELQDGK